jgi:hypothetical protein
MDSLVVKIPVSHTGDREFKSLSIHYNFFIKILKMYFKLGDKQHCNIDNKCDCKKNLGDFERFF